jgi:Nitrite and sulphite reductase 4Fe-4S domain
MGRADLTNLPRKINICISPSRDDFPHTHINDVGFQAVKNPSGEVVFNVEVGGYFSIKRNATSFPLGISVTKDQVRAAAPRRKPNPSGAPRCTCCWLLACEAGPSGALLRRRDRHWAQEGPLTTRRTACRWCRLLRR